MDFSLLSLIFHTGLSFFLFFPVDTTEVPEERGLGTNQEMTVCTFYMVFFFVYHDINDLKHKLSSLVNAGRNIPVGLDIRTTRSTVSLFDVKTGDPEVVTIKEDETLSEVTYLPSEFLHVDGEESFETGMIP